MVCEDNANSFSFSSLCQILERMEKAVGANKKLEQIFNAEMKQLIGGQSFYPIVRLLLPQNDSERGAYGMKHAYISRTYVDALHLLKNSADAQALLFWKDPSKIHSSRAAAKSLRGDFCHILEVRAHCCLCADYTASPSGTHCCAPLHTGCAELAGEYCRL